jgi:putative SOS response-associated peptidase YedK
MCGRFVVARTVGELLTIFEADEIIGEMPGISYNVAPTQNIAILVDRSFEKDENGAPVGELNREFHSARWGLVPRWAKAIEGAPLINGRIETILEKPSFKDSVIRRRCVIPASGYFEWQVLADGSKQPYYIHAGNDGIFALAGLYEWWLDPTKAASDPNRWLLSATTLTKDSAPELSHIHDRNPLLLTPETFEAWIDPHIEGDEDLLQAISEGSDEVAAEALFHKVSAEVGKVRVNEPELIRPI